MEIGTVRQIDINDEMQGAYLDYAMSVIVARALPDVRDGLKPVHRRILYAMHDMGLRPDRAYKKSARIVGEVLGKYHPHGDAAVYESMARMAQDFSLRYVLVDGQGNFGSIDGDSPAAMRYTEARMATITEQMLADIDKETVDFSPNFDDTLTEPSVLPAVLPNLLVNGASGIAVGMTTSIPPHNLGEVVDALLYLIDNYKKLDDVTVEDLTRFIQGPDFPTGGVIYRYAGEDDDGDRLDLIRNAYAVGRGRLKVQANVHIEEMSRNRSRIVVSELPYQVNKTRLIERIAELVRDGKVEGITDLRDESDRQGMRICIELTRTVESREILRQLFKLTPMQTTFSVAMLALVDGEPRLLPIKRVLVHYLEHRQEIITRRSRYLLEKAKLRAHILEGLLKALDVIDQVIDTIRRSRTADTARANLKKRFRFTDIQAQAILDMPLRRLAGLERRNISFEYQEKLKEIKFLEGLLRSPTKIRGVIRDDLVELKNKYGDARRTQIVDREMGQHTARDLVEDQDVLVTLWSDGSVIRTARAPRVSSKAVPLAQVWGNTRDDLAFFSIDGQAIMTPLHQLPDEQNIPVSNLTGLASSVQLANALVLPHPPEGEELPATYLTMVSRGGRIKRVTLEDFTTAASRGTVTAMSVEEGDQLRWVAETGGQDEVLLVTRQGKAIRFSEEEVRPMGLSAVGVWAIKLGKDDAVIGMGIVRPGGFVITFSEQGYVKRTTIKSFPAQKRYGGGVQAAKLTSGTGRLAVAAIAEERADIVLTTSKRRVTKLPVKALHSQGRAASGYRIRQDTKDRYVEPDKHGLPVLLTVLAGTKTAAKRARAGSATRKKTTKAGATKSASTQKTTTKKAPARSRSKAKSTGATKKTTSSRSSKSKTTTTKKKAETPAPMKSAPSKSKKKPAPTKPRSVRSVPK
jgi:DNA gyrase subunit A